MPDTNVLPAEGANSTTVVVNSGTTITPDPVLVAALPEPVFLERAIALLHKVGAYLVDPRTAATLGSIVTLLYAFRVVNEEISQAQVEGALALFAGVATALITVLSAVVLVWKWIDGITIRPPRGLAPWLTEIRARKSVQG